MDLKFLNAERRCPALQGKVSIIVFLTLLFSSFIINQTLAQVHIKEKVEIAPQEITTSELEPGENTLLRLELIGYGGPDCGPYYGVGTYWGNYSGTGNFVLEKINPTGPVEFAITFMTDNFSSCVGTYSIKVYYGGFLLLDASGEGSAVWGTAPYGCQQEQYTFFRGTNVSVAENSECGNSLHFNAEAILDNNVCEGGAEWNPETGINISVSGNAEFLNTETNELMGKEIEISYSEYRNNINKYVIFSKAPYNTESETAVFSANIGGSISSADITLKPQGRFSITENEFCLSNDFASGIEISDYCYYSDIPVKLEITDGSQDASFYSNETGEAIGDILNISENNIYNYYIQADNPNKNPGTFVVEYSALGIVQSDTILINPVGDPVLNANTNRASLQLGRRTKLNLYLGGTNCNYQCPESFTFNVSVTKGTEFGELAYYGENEIRGNQVEILQENSCNANIYFERNEISTQEGDTVIVKVTSSVPGTEEKYIYLLMEPEDFRVRISPPEIAPGDTAEIIPEFWNRETNIYESYPEALFELGLVDQCDVGEILVAGETGKHFVDVQMPFRFIAADEISGDSVVVKLKVGFATIASVTGNGGGEKPGKEQKIVSDAEEQKRPGTKPKNSPNSNLSPNEVLSCPPPFNPDVSVEKEIVIQTGVYLEIIEPTFGKIEWITEEPKMPEVTCIAKLNNYHWGVTFEWEYRVEYDYLRREINLTDTLQRRESRLKFAGISTLNADGTSTWNVPFSLEGLSSFFVKCSKPERPGNSKYGGNNNEVVSTWTEGAEVFTGGKVFVEVKAKDQNGKVIAQKKLDNCWIKGKNPNTNKVYQYVSSKEVEAILKSESRTEQFTSDNIKQSMKWPYETNGFPIYGPPNGYGLMQLDNLGETGQSEKQLWNWKAHLDCGKNYYFKEKKPMAKQHLDYHKNYSDEILLKSAFQMYNGGHLFKWDKEKGIWKINENIEKNRKVTKIVNGTTQITYLQYGIYVWEIYKGLL